MLTLLEQERYARQIHLAQVGEAGQIKLKNARVLVVGAGGLASALLPSLVGSGVGFIRLYDADVLDISNLHRQTLYRMDDVGRLKVEAAQAHLTALNPNVSIEKYAEHLHSANIEKALQNIDVVIDAADRFATTYLLSEYCYRLKIPLVSASVLAEQGYVGAFCGLNSPSYAAIFPTLPKKAQSCASTGVLPSTVAVVAGLQAHMTLNILLDLQPSAMGQLIQLNLSTWHLQRFSFQHAPEPIDPIPWLDEYSFQPDDRVLDFRQAHEIKQDIVQQVEYVTLQDLEKLDFDSAQRIVCVCASGIRASQAVQALKALNITAPMCIAAAF